MFQYFKLLSRNPHAKRNFVIRWCKRPFSNTILMQKVTKMQKKNSSISMEKTNVHLSTGSQSKTCTITVITSNRNIFLTKSLGFFRNKPAKFIIWNKAMFNLLRVITGRLLVSNSRKLLDKKAKNLARTVKFIGKGCQIRHCVPWKWNGFHSLLMTTGCLTERSTGFQFKRCKWSQHGF